MLRLLPTLAALALATTPAAALKLTFSGDFNTDNQIETVPFTLDADGEITLLTTSWIRGDDRLGFDPILMVATQAGEIVALFDDGLVAGSLTLDGVGYRFGVWDAFGTTSLTAGDYQLVIVQYDNYPIGSTLDGPFTRGGQPDFTFAVGFGGATQPLFNGTWDGEDPRTSFWRAHILTPGEGTIVSTPAPAALALFGLGLVGVALLRRR